MHNRIKLAHDLLKDNPEESLAICNEILNDNPKEAAALFIIGHVFLKAERFGLAYNVFTRVSELKPDRPEVWNNLGMCLQKQRHWKEAITYLEKSLKLDPKNTAALNNLGLIYINMANPVRAMHYITKALNIDPTMKDAIENRAMCHLMTRNWGQGWKDYEINLGGPHRKERSYGDMPPRWDGTKNQSIIVYGEQGLGDEIMFSSCIPDVIKDSKKIIIDCDERLKGLFKRSFPKAIVYGTRFKENLSWPLNHKVDTGCAMGSLPMFYRNKDEDYPGGKYLIPDPQRVIQWKALLSSISDKPKVGIAWNGGQTSTGSFERSLTLEDLKPILNLDCEFISLEYKEPDIKGTKIRHWPHATLTKDYDDTAALVESLDLVISVTTTVVHLAGALGKECWCMVPKYPNWRFHMTGQTPWHNSVKLYRQVNKWPIKQIAEDLAKYVTNFHRGRPTATDSVHGITKLNHKKIEQAGVNNAVNTQAATN